MEAPEIRDFCEANEMDYTIDQYGIYYQIIDQGSGYTPTSDSKITVTYTSKFLNNSLLDEQTTTPVSDYLNKFIEGWQIAIPYIQEGGRIRMVIPSSLCYGCNGFTGVVPPNTPIYYDLVLIDVQ